MERQGDVAASRGRVANLTGDGAPEAVVGRGITGNLFSVLGTAPLQYGVFTAGTGNTQPNGIGTFMLVQQTTKYATGCAGACTPGALVIPSLALASVNVP